MNQADDFFSDLKEWSGRKLNIISIYIDGFSRILGSAAKDVYYVDAFAGRGMYDKGEKGSPVLAAEIAQNCQQNNCPFTLHCINIERNDDNYINLCTETQRFGNLVNNYKGSFEENINDILPKIVNSPAVFFLDPFGIKGTDWSAVEQIISRKYSTDIWIRFDHITVRRLTGYFDSCAKDASGKLHTLKDLFGITDCDYLKGRLTKGLNPEERINNAVMLYTEQLEKAFDRHNKKGFAASYPIISISGTKKYHLVFACGHKKAATLASNIVNSIEETYQHEKEEFKESQSGQMSLFSSQLTEKQVFEDKVKKLENAILKLPKNIPFSREDLHFELMIQDKSWFGKIRGKHLTSSLKELRDSTQKIKLVGTPGSDNLTVTILE
jgi:three-Cys-motif partner protein